MGSFMGSSQICSSNHEVHETSRNDDCFLDGLAFDILSDRFLRRDVVLKEPRVVLAFGLCGECFGVGIVGLGGLGRGACRKLLAAGRDRVPAATAGHSPTLLVFLRNPHEQIDELVHTVRQTAKLGGFDFEADVTTPVDLDDDAVFTPSSGDTQELKTTDGVVEATVDVSTGWD